MTEIREKIVQTIADTMKPERPDLQDHSKPLLGSVLDSLDFVSVLMSLEDEFGIVLSKEDTEKISSIDKLVMLIESKKKGM